MTQRVRRNALADASSTRGLATCDPDGLVRNRLIESAAKGACGKQVELRLAPAPVLAQRLEQGWAERQVTIFAALARHHTDDHPLAIDVADLEMREFGPSHAGAVERHQQRPSKKIPGRVDQMRNFFPAQHRWQPAPILRVWQEIAELIALESLDEEEPQRRHLVDHRTGR